MDTKHRLLAPRVSMTPLAACLAIALALPASTALATTRTVTNCADNGSAGSLRNIVATAVSGDTVDLSGLSCSTITLITGAITIPAPIANLTLTGPGASALTIDGDAGGGHHNRVLDAVSSTLNIQGLTIANATSQDPGRPRGGCIYAYNLTLDSSTVSGCTVSNTGSFALGGGIFAENVTLLNSTVTGNRVQGDGTSYGDGGGVYADRVLNVQYSTISNNQAINGSLASNSRGGGLFAGNGNITIRSSTISGNHAITGGGLYVVFGGAPITTAINNSTISGNVATGIAGGVFTRGASTSLSNSTIAFNSAPGSGAGLYALTTGSLQLQSSIIAGNRTSSWDPSDLDGAMAVISGANNLITSAMVTTPLDTVTACPKLGPLANNGGPTETHALLHNVGMVSPAIDSGNNMGALLYDQRSVGYSRTFPLTVIDIGAYEWQGETSDRVFLDQFESVCN